MYWSANQPIVKQCVGQHIDWFSADITTYVSQHIDRCINRDIKSDGQHIDRLSADISVNIEADTWPIRWPLIVGGILVDCRWYISQKLIDCQCQMYKLYAFHPFLVNLKNFWRLHDTSQSTYWPTLDQFVGRHSADMSTDTLVECQLICWPIYRLRGAQNTHDLYPLSFME